VNIIQNAMAAGAVEVSMIRFPLMVVVLIVDCSSIDEAGNSVPSLYQLLNSNGMGANNSQNAYRAIKAEVPAV